MCGRAFYPCLQITENWEKIKMPIINFKKTRDNLWKTCFGSTYAIFISMKVMKTALYLPINIALFSLFSLKWRWHKICRNMSFKGCLVFFKFIQVKDNFTMTLIIQILAIYVINLVCMYQNFTWFIWNSYPWCNANDDNRELKEQWSTVPRGLCSTFLFLVLFIWSSKS